MKKEAHEEKSKTGSQSIGQRGKEKNEGKGKAKEGKESKERKRRGKGERTG